MNELTVTDRILDLEREIQTLPQVECRVTHHFAPGVYTREMFIPAGTVVTGAVHKTEHFNIIVQGRISVVCEGHSVTHKSGEIFTSKAGAKKAVYAHVDTVYMTIHATDETDTAKLVETLTESTESELLGGSKNIQLLNNRVEAIT